MGLCSTTVKKCSDSTLVEVFSKSKKICSRVIPKIYKKSLAIYENSDENMLRSVAVYYHGSFRQRGACTFYHSIPNYLLERARELIACSVR